LRAWMKLAGVGLVLDWQPVTNNRMAMAENTVQRWTQSARRSAEDAALRRARRGKERRFWVITGLVSCELAEPLRDLDAERRGCVRWLRLGMDGCGKMGL
jgi:hypothetical protein